MRQSLKRFFDVYRPFRKVMLGLFGFIALSQALNLVAPYLQGKVIDILIHEGSINRIYPLIAATFAVSIVRVVVLMYWRETYEIKYIDFSVPEHVNRSTLERVMSFSIGQHISENSGLKQSVISRGQHSLTTLAYTVLYQVVPMAIEVILLVGVLLYYSTALGLMVLAGVLMYVGITVFTNAHFRSNFKKIEEMHNHNAKFQGEVLRNVELVLVNAQEKRAVRECAESLGEVSDFTRNTWLGFMKYVMLRNLLLSLTKFSILAFGVLLAYSG